MHSGLPLIEILAALVYRSDPLHRAGCVVKHLVDDNRADFEFVGREGSKCSAQVTCYPPQLGHLGHF